MGSPSSETVRRHFLRPVERSLTSMRPPSAEYLTALSRKMRTRPEREPSSPHTHMSGSRSQLRRLPLSKHSGSNSSTAPCTAELKSTWSDFEASPSFSARARVSSCSISAFIRRDAVRMLSDCRQGGESSALVIITVSGVFSSWEAAATNSRCSSQARSTGRTAQRERAALMPRKARKPSTPISTHVRLSPESVARSLDMSAKTMTLRPGKSAR